MILKEDFLPRVLETTYISYSLQTYFIYMYIYAASLGSNGGVGESLYLFQCSNLVSLYFSVSKNSNFIFRGMLKDEMQQFRFKILPTSARRNGIE